MKKLLLSMCCMLLLGLSSCREDNLGQETTERDRSSYFAGKIESALKFKDFNSYYMKHHLSFDKSDFATHRSGGVTYYEYPVKADDLKNYELSSFFKFIRFSVVAYNYSKGDFKSYLVERCSNENIPDKFYLTGNFATGTVNIYTLDGNIQNNVAFYNGKYIASKDKGRDFGFLNYSPVLSAATTANKEPTCVPTEVSYPVETYTYIDYYKIYQDALTGQTVTQFMNSVLVSRTVSYVYTTTMSCVSAPPPPNSVYNHEKEYLTGNATGCQRSQQQINKTAVKNAVQNLKNNATTPGGGELGFKEMNDGTILPGDINAAHQVTFNDISGTQGGYHNHTLTGIHMFSPYDINTLLSFASVQTVANGPGNAYFGMVSSDNHYIIRFDGTSSDLAGYNFTPEQLNEWTKFQLEQRDLNVENSLYSNDYLHLNNLGLEKLFFDTLKKMGLENKITLQKVDQYNNIYTINKTSNGSTIPVPCF